MNKLVEEINEIFNEALKKSGYVCDEENLVQECAVEGMGDYQCNMALSLSKVYKKSPMDIAGDIAGQLEGNDLIENVSIAKPGYINFFVKKEKIDSFLCDFDEKFDEKLNFCDKKVVVDYGGANVAKPLHVGHLRSATIGESIKRICQKVGCETIGDVHLGDWGLQMGMIIHELSLRHNEWVYFDEKYTGEYPKESPITIKDLETLYPEANAKAKSDEEYMNEAKKATLELQNGRRGYVALWRHILDVSSKDLKKNYDHLNVHFDLWLGESDTQKYYDYVIDEITRKGLAKTSQGALVVDITDENDKNEMPPFILKKTDGAVLYSTTDLATVVQRDKELGVDRIIYVVDNRQEMHFRQLFRCIERTGILEKDIEMDFAGFGTMNGKDGKPYKTRAGGVMQLDSLIRDVESKAHEKILQSGKDIDTLSAENVENIVRKVAISALKFADLSIFRAKDYIFDIDKFCSFEGKTGPYMLYTITRAKSILRKANFSTSQKAFDTSYFDSSMALQLLSYKDNILRAYESLAPNIVADYAYKLANKFNSFYNSCNIINEKNDKKRLSLLTMTYVVERVLCDCMSLLGIEVLDKM